MAAYLMVHFTGEREDGEQIYFSVSKDGLHYRDLNGGEPVIRLKTGEKGIRDPFIIRSGREGGFHIIGTELRLANGKGWEVAQYEGSRNLVVSHSRDLLHWSEPELVEVGIPEAGCVWAPEAIYDRERDAYLVFFASMVKNAGEEKAKQRIYAAYTKDFVTFSQAELYIERENHVIDTTILYEDGVYYRYSKDEVTKRIRCDCGTSLHGAFQEIPSETLRSLAGVEGPIIFPIAEQGQWCLMVDQFATNGGYLPLVTDDLKSGVFRILESTQYDMGQNKKRHGSVLVLTDAEYARLVNAFG